MVSVEKTNALLKLNGASEMPTRLADAEVKNGNSSLSIIFDSLALTLKEVHEQVSKELNIQQKKWQSNV